MFRFTPLFLIFFTSCCLSSPTCFTGSKYLSVFSEPIDKTLRASTHVNTPDPAHFENPHGLRIQVSWHLPKSFLGQKLELKLGVRFKKPFQEEINYPIDALNSSLTYEVTNEDYFSRGGVLSYQAELYVNGEKVDAYKHRLWVDLIQVQ